jgi:predicted MPP superfamily phosphohydrolase
LLPALLVLCAAVVWVSNSCLEVGFHRLCSSKLPAKERLTIALLSDLHGRRLGRQNRRLVRTIDAHTPDLVIMAGDMIDGDGKNQTLFGLVEALADRYPLYYTQGNHEQRLHGANWHKLQQSLKQRGVQLLDNAHIPIPEANVRLYGAWSEQIYQRDPGPSGDDRLFSTRDLTALIGSSDPDVYNILTIHTPAFFQVYADWGADLTLCGHMHGGMIRLPFFGGLLSPYRRFFPTYDAGIYTHDGRCMVVSRGLGNGKVGFRILSRPELVIIELVGEAEQE